MKPSIFIKEGWKLNPNEKRVESIRTLIENNNGNCICHNESYDKHCPCSDYLCNDCCHCGLYCKKEKTVGVISTGVVAPIIKEGDDIVSIVVTSVLNSIDLKDNDVIGITESVVARAAGNYVTVDDIANETKRLFGDNAHITLLNPIYSRNRFSMILKGIARGAKSLTIIMPDKDEVGNPRGVNPFTGVNIEEYYKDICISEHCEVNICHEVEYNSNLKNLIDCSLRPKSSMSLKCFFVDKCEYGLLGSNKATEEKLKLFPSKLNAEFTCLMIKESIKRLINKDVIVCIYGDGCFKDPVGGIWEFADPVTMPAYTNPEIIESTPNELKLKYLIDNGADNISTLIDNNRKTNKFTLNKTMNSEGTTPRLYRDLLASLMDLTSGSGDRATPIVVIQNYFK